MGSLVFVDTIWQITAAFILFFIGFFVVFWQKRTFRISTGLAFSLYLWHTCLCFFYYFYSLSNPADSRRYFLSSFTYDAGPATGTRGIIYFVSFLTNGIDLSYGNIFLLTNIFGFIGLIALASSFKHTSPHLAGRHRLLQSIVLFLPSVSFWSAAIGKDSLTFLAGGMLCWGVLNASRRFIVFVVAALLYLLARPHIFGIFLLSLAVSSVLLSKMGFAQKAILSIILLPVAVAGVFLGLEYAGLGDASDISDVGDYIEMRQSSNLGGGSSIDIASMLLPMQLFSYLFRPLPLEIGGLFGFVTGLENIFLLGLFFYFARNAVRGHSVLPAFPRYFLIIFSAITLVILALTTANLGIALRQKWMFMPMLLLLGFSYLPQNAYARYQAQVRQLQHRRFRHNP